MKKLTGILLTLCLLLATACAAVAEETTIVLGDGILVNGAPITEDAGAAVHLVHRVETHGDVPAELAGLSNRVVTIADGGVYRVSGTGMDVQLAVRADDTDDVRIILDGAAITCRTAPAVAVYSARDPRTAGEYAVTIELAAGSDNRLTGSHTVRIEETDVKLDGAVCSLVSLGFEGSGSLAVDADNEGVEVKYGHMTINGGVFHIEAGDDPLNVSEDGVGVLTVNDGYLYSAVKNAPGGEGDGIDSNGWIVFNGGTAINLAHPTSQDGGIDSDMGSSINGGIIVGAGNMYDPIESTSGQLFMMLEFTEQTDDLVVVTDAQGTPVFAYDFPYDYMYIAFSTPQLQEGGVYNVYLGGEIEGEQQDGLYTSITAYKPGRQMMHGGGVAEQRNMGMQTPPDMQGFVPGMQQDGMAPGGMDAQQTPGQMGGMQQPGGQMPGDMGGAAEMMAAWEALDLNELLRDVDLNELLKGKDLNSLLTGFSLTDLLTEEQIRDALGDNVDMAMLEMLFGRGGRGMGGFGGMMPGGMQSSADVATTRFVLTRENTAFSNVSAVEDGR